MYTFKTRVRYSELNHQKGILDASSIINYFQDCSTFQSEDLNRGLSFLNAKNKMWLLNGWQLELLNPPPLGEMITVGTWAYDFKGFYGYRNFIMQNENNDVLAVANSIWVYIDLLSGKPIKIPADYAKTSGYGMEPPYPMEYASRKIELPEDFICHPSYTIVKSNIDSYNHVNNGQYIKMAEEYLPEDFMIQTMRVEYRMQAVLGDLIIPMVSRNSNTYTVVLADASKRAYAVIEFHGYTKV